jgi:hypothetical protein
MNTDSRQPTTVTGRDGFIIADALAIAIEVLSRVPVEMRLCSVIDDMREMLGRSGNKVLHMLQAEQRIAALMGEPTLSGEEFAAEFDRRAARAKAA